MPSSRSRAARSSRPNCGWRRDRGVVRTSASAPMAFDRSSSTNSSALRVEWPIVQIRMAGIREFPFNLRAGEHCASRRQVYLQLLVVLRGRFAGLQLENCDATAPAPYETVERSPKNDF